ncbi:MAG: heme biosynthesis protein HemY [Xanthomonadaceae bacterium]|nr:heme biosynthesis protein HemY [Xanthomonadaceae bacterium]MDE1884811.1 heme biosynthesis protein HemY [Xanthomonadaceae bacterium]MDE2083941.1 heme biosynthesis protein HemY [Xanthomonadaceae bacterium]MDE2256819.1 heme biosynthesis protein HemY [Xanthomonadaceae bacterium]
MKLWIILIGLLMVAGAAIYGWQMLAADPGLLSIRIGHTHIDTTLVFAVFALLAVWILLGLLWRGLRWPLRAWRLRGQRRSRERFAAGLTALAEGDHRRALRALEKASHEPELHVPAQLATARAAHARGDAERTEAALDEAAKHAPAAALSLRAQFLLEHGNAEAAVTLLKPSADHNELAPVGWRLLAEAALLTGDPALALRAVDALAAGDALTPQALTALRARALMAALAATPDTEALNALWSGLPRAQRAMPEAIAAYARRAATLGQPLSAMDELESALRKQWSERLVGVWGQLGPAHADTRLARAEGWLAAQPDSPELLLALGRLCVQGKLWGKAREYLERGLALTPSGPLWETLGECMSGQGNPANAALCYRNALRIARGESTQALADAARAPLDTRASIAEERDAHGLPRLAIPKEN